MILDRAAALVPYLKNLHQPSLCLTHLLPPPKRQRMVGDAVTDARIYICLYCGREGFERLVAGT
ncbi:hypothetical protein KCP75_07520 [Salmonella enterica subsp. enterica]|nr:hypothetical protein KCP75_07520 [Salmonella enterica subsp. enterica]